MILCREEFAKPHRLGGVPRPAGRPARAHHRRQGRALRIAASEPFRERQERTLAGARAVAAEFLSAGRWDQRPDRRHRRAPGPLRPARVRARRQAGRGPPRRRRHHRQPQRRPVRPPAPGRVLGPANRYSALATRGLQADDFVEVGRIIAEALASDDFEAQRADLADRAARDRRALPALQHAPRGHSCHNSVAPGFNSVPPGCVGESAGRYWPSMAAIWLDIPTTASMTASRCRGSAFPWAQSTARLALGEGDRRDMRPGISRSARSPAARTT